MKRRRSALLIALVAGVVGIGGLALVWFNLRGGTRRPPPLPGPLFFTPPTPEQINLPPATEFGEPRPPGRVDAADFTQVFAKLNLTLVQGDVRSLTGLFDMERMVDEVIRVGGPVGGTRTATAEWVTQETAQVLSTGLRSRWERTDVRVVRWSTDRQEALVSAVHKPLRGRSGGVVTRRWWLTKRSGSWKIYDWEDVATGWRHAPGLAPDPLDGIPGGAGPDGPARVIGPVRTTPPNAVPPGTGPRVDVIAHLHEALDSLYVRGDANQADALLGPVRGVNLPDPLAALRETAEGTLLARRGDPVGALARFDEADRLTPGIPRVTLARAEALTRAGRLDDADRAIRDYTREVGTDAAAIVAEAAVLEARGRPDEAKAALRRALDENPDSLAAFHGLWRLLPADGKAELGERLAEAREPATLFLILVGKAREEGDAAAVAALIAGMKAARPGDANVAVEEIRELVRDGRYADATAVFRATARSPSGVPNVLTAYLLAMAQAGRHLDAYEAVLPVNAGEAFRYLAASLEMLLTTPGGKSDAAATLGSLVAAHRRRDPNDPWLWYYEGAVLRAGAEYEQAEQSYAEGLTRLGQQGGPELAWARDLFRARRIDCFYEAKQGMKGYATVTPAAVAFRHLAQRYAADRDVAGLAELVAAHQSRFAGDPVVVYWLAEVHFLKGEYAQAATKYREFQRAAAESDPETGPARERLIRSLIRDNQPRAARGVVANDPQRVSPGLWVAVLAAEGNPQPLDAALRDQDRAPGGLAVAYHDEDFARLIADPKFADLRQKYPDPRPRPPGKGGK